MGYLEEGRVVRGLLGDYHVERRLAKSRHHTLFTARVVSAVGASARRMGEHVLLKELHATDIREWSDIERLRAEARRPVVLTIEDLHWGDLPSVNAIDVALRELHDRPFLVVATARPEVRELFPKLWASRGVVEVALHALAPRACAEIATDALGAQATPEVIDALVARCEGNAFYLEELIRAVVDGGGDLGALPATVVGTVQARLAALDGEARRVLRAAAVFGEVFAVPGVASET